MREFKVDKLITLRLINGKTILFVNNHEFKQCKILLLKVPLGDQSSEEIKSIDEAAEHLDSSMGEEYTDININPETIFWGHYSNLQAWIENYYDTDLLHKSLAFPLLKILSKEGDKLAKQKFKEEVSRYIKRTSH